MDVDGHHVVADGKEPFLLVAAHRIALLDQGVAGRTADTRIVTHHQLAHRGQLRRAQLVEIEGGLIHRPGSSASGEPLVDGNHGNKPVGGVTLFVDRGTL